MWTDVTNRVMDRRQPITTFRGSTDSHREADAGDLGLVLRNSDRHLDKNHTGPWAAFLKAGVPIKVTGTPAGGTETPVWWGTVKGFPQKYDRGNRVAWVPITAFDPFDKLSRARIPRSVIESVIAPLEPLNDWPLNDPAGSLSATDVTGRNFGVVVDELSFDSDELGPGLGPSAEFDGVNDRIDVSTGPIITDPTEFSVVGVFRTSVPAEAGTIHPIFFQSNGNTAATSVQIFIDTDGTLRRVGTVNGAGAGVYNPTVVTDGRPHIFFAQRNTVAVDFGVAIDSIDLDTTTFSAATQSGDGTAIGGTPGGSRGYDANYFEGNIGRVVVWDRVLDATERQLIFDGFAALDGQTTDERMDWILDELGWPADARDFDTGRMILGPATFKPGDDALDYLRLLTASEDGRLFATADGKLRFLERYQPWLDSAATIPQLTFTDTPGFPGLADIEIEPEDDEQIVNAARYTRRGGSQQVAKDQDSIDEYGEAGDPLDDLLVATDAQALSLAQWVVSTRAWPLPRIPSLNILLHKLPPAQQAQVLGLEIGDRVRITRTPQKVGAAFTLDCIVEGIRHQITKVEWHTELVVSPAFNVDIPLFTLGTSQLGGTHILAH